VSRQPLHPPVAPRALTGQVQRLFPGPPAELDRDGLTAAYTVNNATGDGGNVRANFVLSADGAAEVGGSSRPLGGPVDLRVLALLRGLCDVVLVGAGTVRAEDYAPARPDPARQAWRQAHGLAPVPPIAVVSARLDLDPGARFFTAAVARPLVITTAPAARAADSRRALAEVADIVEVTATVPTALTGWAILAALAERGLRRVLCEGGPQLLGELVRSHLLDELCLTLSPQLVGGQPTRMLGGVPLSAGLPLQLRHVLTEDGLLFLRYAVAR
jgi:riboflavin biosynthesis pyrimidine reductase